MFYFYISVGFHFISRMVIAEITIIMFDIGGTSCCISSAVNIVLITRAKETAENCYVKSLIQYYSQYYITYDSI